MLCVQNRVKLEQLAILETGLRKLCEDSQARLSGVAPTVLQVWSLLLLF